MLAGKNRHRHGFHLRHRPGHCRSAGRQGRQCRPEFLQRQRRGSRQPPNWIARTRRQGDLRPGRHVEAGRMPRPRREDTEALGGRRHPRQQCRHPACRAGREIPARALGRHHRDQSPPPSTPWRRFAGDAAGRLGSHRQHRLRARPARLDQQVGLCRGQARRGRPDQGRGAGKRGGRHHLQRRLPRLRAHAAGREADRGSDGRKGPRPRHGGARPDALQAADPRIRDHRQIGETVAFLCSDAPPRSPAPPCPSTAAGRRSSRGRAQAHQHRASGRRLARRLHLGRARPPAGGRPAGGRGRLRHQRRRDECGRLRRWLGGRRRGRRPCQAGQLLAFGRPQGSLQPRPAHALGRLGQLVGREFAGFLWFDAMARTFSPYVANPLRLQSAARRRAPEIDFDRVRRCEGPGCSSRRPMSRPASRASSRAKASRRTRSWPRPACRTSSRPSRSTAFPIWDGGYGGNPPLYPFFYASPTEDVLLIQINPVTREGVPKTAREIQNRIDEITFNAGLLREFRAIAFVKELIAAGRIDARNIATSACTASTPTKP
jgi:hypothetical protein